MSLITYQQLDNNVHKLFFIEANRRSSDEFIEILTDFYQNVELDNVYLLLDLRESGMLPLRRLTTNMRHINEEYPNHPAVHIALALNDGLMVDVTSALMRTIMRRDSIQYFTDIDKAYQWLEIEQDKRQ